MSITTALVGLILATAAGVAFDSGQQVKTSQKLQSISDAAALAAMAEPGLSQQQRKALAFRAVEDFAVQSGAQFDNLAVDAQVRQSGERVYVSLATEVPMLFGALTGADSRLVSVESLSEEYMGSNMTPLSISVVLDLSSSMADRFDSGSKIAGVKAALNNIFGETTAPANMKSGVYAFNWGAVADETAPLAPGTAHVRSSLQYVTLSEGTVPTTAMEAALRDQSADRANSPAMDRFIVFITDGDVDDEKADQRGRYLADGRVLSDESAPGCAVAIDDVEEAKGKLAQHYNNISQNSGGLLGFVTSTAVDLINSVDDLLANPQGNGTQRLKNWRKKYDDAQNSVEDLCVFEQTERVLDVCEAASRDEDISIISVNLSGEEGEAESLTQQCLQAASLTRPANQTELSTLVPFDDLPTERLANGLEVTLSEDGQSMYAAVESLDDLRHVLSSMMPERDVTRSVRLVR